MSRLAWSMVLLAVFAIHTMAQDKVIITEFMAANKTTLTDVDGAYSDWIEIYNGESTNVNLAGWSLTDSAASLQKWQFPATNMAPKAYLVVFASGKDRRVPGLQLHTSFQLTAGGPAGGEYLALVKPDGTNVNSEFSPTFPQQFNDISYGISALGTPTTLLATNAPVRVYVPTNDVLVTSWTALDFDDSNWLAGTNGVGYDSNGTEPGQTGSQPFAPYIKTDITALMSNVNASVYLRLPFQLPNPNDVDSLTLRMRYDDGFVAYLNGTEVYRRNAPTSNAVGQVASYLGELSGTQGANNWYYGYYNFTTDPGQVYQPADFIPFPANYWTGAIWDWPAGNPPWTQVGDIFHPNGNNNGNVHWAMARWVSEANGSVSVTINLRKQNTGGGNGTTGKLFVNGVEVFSRTIGGTDGVGIVSTFTLTGINVGDYFDFALTPRGTDGTDNDGSDGTYFYFTIDQLPGADLTWNSSATGLHLDTLAVTQEDFDLTPYIRLLNPGTNVLAIQGLNVAATNVDFLIQSELQMRSLLIDSGQRRYFLQPTPGRLNGVGATTLGARIAKVEHLPLVPKDNEDLVVTAQVLPTVDPIVSVTLVYRIMFGTEVSLTMYDDGLHGDGQAGDGTFGAAIPANAAIPGQMIRWFVLVRDASGLDSKWPLAEDAVSPKYQGTIVDDPTIVSKLPVLHWFIETPTAANTDAGTRCSVFFNGQFLDNVGATLHGQSSSGFPKKSYNFNLNSDYKMTVTPDIPALSDFALLTTWADRTYVRNMLSTDTYVWSGVPAHFTFAVRVHQNGAYYSLANIMEQGNNEYLDRIGYDNNGALYKIYNTLTTASTAEKKTRKWDPAGNSDLVDLVAQVNSTDANARLNYIYDNVNLPSLISFVAAKDVNSDHDCCHKNYYLYRDTDGTAEWYHLPWDFDLCFGHKWNSTPNYFDDTITTNVQVFVGNNSALIDKVYNDATLRSLWARRIRTLMDELVQPPATPTNTDLLRDLITRHTELVRAEAARDKAKWGGASWFAPTYGPANPTSDFDIELDRVKGFYLTGRRAFLFVDNVNNGQIPQAQPTNTVIRFGQYDVNPASRNQDQEYLELLNTNNYAADISGWKLQGGVNFTFRPGTVIPANGRIYVSPNVRAFRTRTTGPGPGQKLLAVGPYKGQLSLRGESLALVSKYGQTVSSLATPVTPSPAQQFLRVTEIMYHPAKLTGDTTNADEYEYLELKNISTNTALNLTGVHFTNGIDYNFTGSAVTNLAAGERVLVVKNLAAFTERYGPRTNIAGVYTGNLENGGETLRLEDASNEKILDFSYDNDWYPITDGVGFALAIVDETALWDTWSQKTSWQPSGEWSGSPGQANLTPPVILPVFVNEALTRSTSQVDAVELYNPNSVPVNIGGWFLTDDFQNPRKFRITDGTVIGTNSYLVFTETEFQANPVVSNRFAFGAKGDQVYLFSGDAQTNLTGYYHGFDFGGAAADVTFGRYINSVGGDQFVAQISNSLGATNAGPRVGPVVINEIMFHPPDLIYATLAYDNKQDEFVELFNVSTNAVWLGDPLYTWRLRDALSYTFPTNASLSAGGFLLVVNFDPQIDLAALAEFRARYNLSTNVPLFGPYGGNLGNAGNSVELARADLFEDGGTDDILMDKVRYDDGQSFPCGADGTGNSLQRLLADHYGNDPFNWASKTPTPGAATVPQAAGLATILAQPQDVMVATNGNFSLQIQICSPAAFAYQWLFNGSPLANATNQVYSKLNAATNDSGLYSVAVIGPYGAITSEAARVYVQLPPSIMQQPQNQTVRGFTTVSIPVQVAGTPPFWCQWKFNGTNLVLTTNTTLVLNNVQKPQQGTYSVLVWNAAGQIQSASMTLLVQVPARVLGMAVIPATLTATNANTVTFTPTLAGDSPMNYQWYFNANSMTNGTNAILSMTGVQAPNEGTYQLVVSNTFGMDTSAVFFLTVYIKPGFSSNPASLMMSLGEPLQISATVTGTPPFQFKWQKVTTPLVTNSTPLFTDTFTLPNMIFNDAGLYRVTAYNIAQSGGISGGFGYESVVEPPVNRQVLLGSNVTLTTTVAMPSQVTPYYQWLFAGTNIGNTLSVTLTNVQPDQAGTYTLMVSNSQKAVRYYTCQLTVQTEVTAPAIVRQPDSVVATLGGKALFITEATGTDPLTYQWWFKDTNLVANATNRFLTFTNVVANNLGNYTVVVSNNVGWATSVVATLDIGTPPAISEQPTNQAVNIGGSAIFAVNVTGSAPLSYQWWFNGTNLLAGRTNAALSLADVQPADAGSYQVVVGNAYGMITSAVAALTVNAGVIDTDGDGIPDDWERDHGLVVGVNDAQTDSDGDGLTNFQEYLAGTDPLSKASVLKLETPASLSGTGQLTLSFNAVSNHSYTVEWRGAVAGQTWQTLLNVPLAPSNYTVIITNQLGTNTQQYFRLGTP